METIEINKVKYEVVRNDNGCLEKEDLSEKITDYFEPFDYVFGDFSYEKVRLKGYNSSDNKKVTKINDIKYLDDYIENYCSYGADVFLLKKVK